MRLQLVLDDAARTRFGFDGGQGLTGPVPVKLAARMSADKESRMLVEADLTQAKIDNLMPGWVKPAGKRAARPSRSSPRTRRRALRTL